MHNPFRIIFGPVAFMAAGPSAFPPATDAPRPVITTAVSFRVDGQPVRPKVPSRDLRGHQFELVFGTTVSSCVGSCPRTYHVSVFVDFETLITAQRVTQKGSRSETMIRLSGVPTDRVNHCITTIVENANFTRDRSVSSAFVYGARPSDAPCITGTAAKAPLVKKARSFSTCGSPIRLTPDGLEVPMCDVEASIFQISVRNEIERLGRLTRTREFGVWVLKPGVVDVNSRILYVTRPTTEGVTALGSMGASVSERSGSG